MSPELSINETDYTDHAGAPPGYVERTLKQPTHPPGQAAQGQGPAQEILGPIKSHCSHPPSGGSTRCRQPLQQPHDECRAATRRLVALGSLADSARPRCGARCFGMIAIWIPVPADPYGV